MGMTESLKSGDWEHESYPAYEDYAVLSLFALFFPLVRFLLDTFVFEKLGRRLIFGKGQAELDMRTDERQRKLSKLKESAWKFVYYTCAEIYPSLVCDLQRALVYRREELLGRTRRSDLAGPEDEVEIESRVHYSIFALVFWETRRSDFGVSMAHHVATVALVALSYIYLYVFLEIGKMSKYTGAEGLASAAFIFFVLSWILLRLIYYSFWILSSTSYEVLLTLDRAKHERDGSIYYYTFNTLLCGLFVLHVYWWVLIYRMLVKQIQARGRLSDDVRSDSDTDSEHED